MFDVKKRLILAGYITALLCFLISLCLRIGNEHKLVDIFLIIGGVILTITSVFNLCVGKEKDQ